MTIYQIAAEAGLSASTVSRVANNKPGVKAETREKVLKLFEKYHFSLDAAAKGLVKGDTRIVGILVEDLRLQHHTESAYIIERELAAKGYDSLIFNTGDDDLEKKRCIQSLASRRAQAIVMIGSTFQSDAVCGYVNEYLAELPIVMVNGYLPCSNVYGVLADEETGVKNSVEYLVSKKRKRIAFITYGHTISNIQKEKGYADGIKLYNSQQEPIVLNIGERGTIDDSRAATLSLLEKDKDIDAIIYATDFIAVAGMHALREKGFSIPQDISIVGIDNSLFAQLSFPPMTSVDNNSQEISMTCAGMLINIMEGKSVPHRSLVFSELVEREST